MSRALSMLIGCVVAVAVAGCGSSSSSSGTSSEAASVTASTTTSGSRSAQIPTKPNFASPSPSQPVRSGAVQVDYHNITINPDTLRVKVGTTVTWVNQDSVEHTVTSQSGPQKFSSGTFGEGHTFSVKLTTPGVIHYRCMVHPVTMNGTIEVVR